MGGARAMRRIGKILRAVFDPDSLNIIGYLVDRPEILFMYKPPDRFLAWDSFKVVDGRVLADAGAASWDDAACRRLAVDWDEALIVEGMKVLTPNGTVIGAVRSANYDETTGQVDSFEVSDGAAAKALLGVTMVPRELVVGFKDGAIVARREAAEIATEGGLAAQAGEQVAVVADQVKRKTAEMGKAAGEVSEAAGKAVGRAIGKMRKKVGQAGKSAASEPGETANKTGQTAGQLVQTGSKALGRQLRRSKSMFSDFKAAYDAETKPGKAAKSAKTTKTTKATKAATAATAKKKKSQ